jgi:hypothetical protein
LEKAAKIPRNKIHQWLIEAPATTRPGAPKRVLSKSDYFRLLPYLRGWCNYPLPDEVPEEVRKGL